MVSESRFSSLGRSYLSSVIAVGIAVIAMSIQQLYAQQIGYPWFVLAALTLLSGSATLQLPSSYASISISETFVITAALLYGPAAATVIVSLDALAISFWISKRHRDQPHRALFNISAPALSAWFSAHLFFSVARISPLVQEPAPVNAILPALALFALTYFALNSWLITFVISLERNLNPLSVWTDSFLWLSLNYFGGASLAILFVGYNRTIDLGYLGLILPLLIVLYFTFKTTMGRVNDANNHVEQLNRLYLSTIETLAMAIDAKDQVTHGHIRRVQMYATRLAREVGIKDEKLIRAIEAAALLHDMGKLAVPEYILNKPGKLTDAEFEKMKLHASVGADILSAIEFPYPVVPIVRHHHENWNGKGYPDGLRGTEIPIGARILSVVDCFDALTSDRPYRPRLSNDEAIEILMERRGSMYDPLIIDTFTKVHPRIAVEEPIPAGPPPAALDEIATARKTAAPHVATPVLDEIAASADEMLTLYELARSLAGQVSVSDAGDVIANHLRRLIPSSLCVFYLYDDRANEIEAKHAVGDGSKIVQGMRIPIGQRLSGWVAANRQTISNSDPVLDLGEPARARSLALRSCISTPLLADDNLLVGVLTLYAGEVNAFNEDHRRIVEVVARQIAHTFRRAVEFDESPRRDQLTGLPSEKQLESFVQSSLDESNSAEFALLLIDIDDLKGINVAYGRGAGDDVIRHVVQQTRHGLRMADILFRSSSDELVAYLNATDRETAHLVAVRIRDRISREPLLLRPGSTLVVHATVTAVHAPHDGRSLDELLAAARRRVRTATADSEGASVH